MTTQTQDAAYTGTSTKPEENSGMDAGVSQERRAEILQQNASPTESIEGVIAKITSGTDDIRVLTLKDKSMFQQAVLKACYAIGITNPESELEKTKTGYESKSRLLENLKGEYQTNKTDLETEIKHEQGWVFDSDKILEELEGSKETLEKELGYETEEIKKCKAAYKTVPTKDQKEELIEMVRGYDASKTSKDQKIEQLEEEIEMASDSFNDHYDDLQDLRSDKNEEVQILQAISHLQKGYKRVAKTYGKIIKKSNKGKITDCKLLAALAGDLNSAKSAKQELEQIHKKRKAGIAGIPAAIQQSNIAETAGKEEETAQVKRVSEAGVHLAKQRRSKLYTAM